MAARLQAAMLTAALQPEVLVHQAVTVELQLEAQPMVA
jgi:hypothetical protein